MGMRKNAQALDQYYTRPAVAQDCLRDLAGVLWAHARAQGELPELFIEPSAGAGSFLDGLPSETWWAGDQDPRHPQVVQHDFLADGVPHAIQAVPDHQRVVVGNPPFGRKGDTAVAFINHALTLAPLVGFVLPLQFRKWSAQSRVDPSAELVFDRTLPEDAFTFLGKPYQLRCCFQIWARRGLALGPLYLNRRLQHAPPNQHPDFEAWQYNRTPIAEKYFDMDWDFAVLRQGYGDFSRLFWRKDAPVLDRKQQWAFLKAKNPQVLDRLARLDFVGLSQRNTGTPGFGKADLVEAYMEIVEQETRQ